MTSWRAPPSLVFDSVYSMSRPCSSVGQSGCLLSSGSHVRVVPGAPRKSWPAAVRGHGSVNGAVRRGALRAPVRGAVARACLSAVCSGLDKDEASDADARKHPAVNRAREGGVLNDDREHDVELKLVRRRFIGTACEATNRRATEQMHHRWLT